ncbi:MAG: hypothetical protein MUE40_18815 [Anaerolineae bacterium]|nr:hypothetical protein [Anaerolineae bacterium]
MLQPQPQPLALYPLRYSGDCALLALTPAGDLLVEEWVAGEWLAQHHLAADGRWLASVDEQRDGAAFHVLPLPAGALRPAPPPPLRALELAAVRYQGLREAERLTDWVQPLTLAEKLPLIAALRLPVTPMHLAGLAESRVLSAAALDDADRWWVCRRVRLALLLPQPRPGPDGLPCDYETRPLWLAHEYDARRDVAPPLHEALSLAGVPLLRPLECLRHGDRLYLAEGGQPDTGQLSRISVWHLPPR